MKGTITREEAYKILEEYGTPDHVIKHGEAVANVAVKVGERLKEKGLDLDLDLAFVCGVLHDMARLEEEHAQVAGDWLCAHGHDVEGNIIREHMHYPRFNEVENTTEIDLICLGDRVCIENRYVGVEKRFEYIFKKHKLNPARKPILDAKKKEIHEYIDKLSQFMGISLDELMKE